ncbi:uncharacterized protein ACLA_058500 [Aspergillus clavatus NRRL 1]|uniref:Uncharacterized protein n=1 Tax=Aspergillus clavatus (strain ATCC 1007 / CBS 513.65 / DSM 816 / NCTC 3887 / NRRL 1 / QM 1276 / 107) TaxID=344612 RepID=A1C450_ASPCL|nr:uncharacterized protein ACLA_058500 [Aspergillus clavatus NRRL 1]EAW15190.1 hypothetical protein ACLA_058500 [Aspergillus clavatus NRRL 1]
MQVKVLGRRSTIHMGSITLLFSVDGFCQCATYDLLYDVVMWCLDLRVRSYGAMPAPIRWYNLFLMLLYPIL